MLGITHAATGTAAGAVLVLGCGIEDLAASAGCLIVSAGSSLLPDLDTPDSTAARAYGLPGRTLATLIGAITSGHRGATHDPLVAPLVAGLLAWACTPSQLAAGALIAVIAGFVLRLVGIRSALACTGLAAAVGGALARGIDSPLWWLPLATATGVLVHILGDAVTNHSVPAPLSWARPTGARRMWTSPLATGSRLERWLILPLFLSLAILLAIPAIIP